MGCGEGTIPRKSRFNLFAKGGTLFQIGLEGFLIRLKECPRFGQCLPGSLRAVIGVKGGGIEYGGCQVCELGLDGCRSLGGLRLSGLELGLASLEECFALLFLEEVCCFGGGFGFCGCFGGGFLGLCFLFLEGFCCVVFSLFGAVFSFFVG